MCCFWGVADVKGRAKRERWEWEPCGHQLHIHLVVAAGGGAVTLFFRASHEDANQLLAAKRTRALLSDAPRPPPPCIAHLRVCATNA